MYTIRLGTVMAPSRGIAEVTSEVPVKTDLRE